jgi:hypothetical protein
MVYYEYNTSEYLDTKLKITCMGFRDFFGGKPKPMEISKLADDSPENQQSNSNVEASEESSKRSQMEVGLKMAAESGNKAAQAELQRLQEGGAEHTIGQRVDQAVQLGKKTYGKISGMFQKAWGIKDKALDLANSFSDYVGEKVENKKDSALQNHAMELGLHMDNMPPLDSPKATQTILGLEEGKRSMAGELMVGGNIFKAVREYRQNVAAIKEAYERQLQENATNYNLRRGNAMAMAERGAPQVSAAEKYSTASAKEGERLSALDSERQGEAAKAKEQADQLQQGRAGSYSQAASREAANLGRLAQERQGQEMANAVMEGNAQKEREGRYNAAVAKESAIAKNKLESAKVGFLKLNSFEEFQSLRRQAGELGIDDLPEGKIFLEIGPRPKDLPEEQQLDHAQAA